VNARPAALNLAPRQKYSAASDSERGLLTDRRPYVRAIALLRSHDLSANVHGRREKEGRDEDSHDADTDSPPPPSSYDLPQCCGSKNLFQ